VDQVVLVGYQAALCAVAVTLLTGLLREPSHRAAVADLVVELTGSPTGTLRDALARTRGDPTIGGGYWLPADGGYVDARGEPLVLPQGRHDRAVSPIDIDGRRVGVIVHDPAIGSHQELMDAIAVAAELASANARLQAEVRAQVAEVEASRRRLVDAGDEQRRRLQHRLRSGARRRRDAVADTLAEAQTLAEQRQSCGTEVDQIAAAQQQLRRTVGDVDELARGLHPPALETSGLAVALSELVERTAAAVTVRVANGRLPPEVEAAVYFVCAEALVNIDKHAAASAGTVAVTTGGGCVVVTIDDDGVGGAALDRGTGLQGLADRVEALGGSLTVDSPMGRGTRLTAEIPLGDETA
jgi:signal transduction histidine kinase